MKKLFALIAVFGLLFMGASIFAQDETTEALAADDATQVAEEVAVEEVVVPVAAVEVEEESGLKVLHTTLKTKFIEGGAGFMGAVLLSLIFGLALAFERIIYLNLSTTNTDKLLEEVEEALNEGGIDAAKATRGDPWPVYSTRVLTVLIRELKWLRNQLSPTVVFRWVFLRRT